MKWARLRILVQPEGDRPSFSEMQYVMIHPSPDETYDKCIEELFNLIIEEFKDFGGHVTISCGGKFKDHKYGDEEE